MPEPPRYRETRPLRFGAAAIGLAAGLGWFVLLLAVSWSPLSSFLLVLAGVLAATGAVAVLSWRGDRGVGAGLAVVTGIAAAVLTVATWVHLP
jgi:CBS-domain-containing membrane protein